MRRCLILFLLLAVLPAGGAAQTEQPTLETYQSWLRTAYAAATRADRIGLEAIAEQLVAARAVQLPDGTSLPMDNRWLRDALRQEPPDYAFITGRIGATLDALGQPEGAAPADAQERLDQIFSRPPFANRVLPAFVVNAWETLQWIFWAIVDMIFKSVAPAGAPARAAFGALSPLGWLLLSAGLALVLGLLWYAVRGVRVSLRRDRAVEAAAEEASLSSSDALQRAHDLGRGGDYRSAVRYLYLSSLLWLDERKLLRYDRSLTNREYLAQVRNNPDLHGRLAPVVNTFDRVWYGKRSIDGDQFEAYQEQVESLCHEEPPR